MIDKIHKTNKLIHKYCKIHKIYRIHKICKIYKVMFAPELLSISIIYTSFNFYRV